MTRGKPGKAARQRALRKQAKTAFAASRKAEARYVRALVGTLRGAADATIAALAPHFRGDRSAGPEAVRSDAAFGWSAALSRVEAAIRGRLAGIVGGAFDAMASVLQTSGYKAAAKILGVRATELGINAQIARARDRNIRLVEDAHRAYAESVRAIIGDPANFNKPWEEIRDLLLARGDVSESRAELIARDQTLKLNGEIAQTRMKNAGVRRYTWSTSRDERVRPDHAALEGQEFSWEAPPVVDERTGRREHPGQDFQCRCVAIPVIDDLEGLDL